MWNWQANSMEPRHYAAIVAISFVFITSGFYPALAVTMFVVVPLLYLSRVTRKVGQRIDRRVSMTTVAGPSRFYPCTYCGRPGESWDHIIPWSRGGGDGPDNRTPSCVPCNSSKGDSTPEEWWERIGHGAPMPPHWPRTGVNR